ncbi:SDR family oxidoreductase [Roseibium sp. SCPC15]|uniref:SDR family oxidoreductase n=1 Tax=Roseibium sp. SCP15 TaxID=3141376 RepID=UPI00333DEE88
MTVLVTGATGTIGAELVGLLVKDGLSVKALSRSSDRLSQTFGQGVEAVTADLEDTAALGRAMTGVETLVLITPASETAARHAAKAIEAARYNRVRKIVRISAIKASLKGPTHNTRLHAQTEADLIASGIDYVILRPNYFMQNMFLAAEQIAKTRAFSFATGQGRMAMIDARDIALCAFRCVKAGDWNGQILELTGPEAISFDEVAERLSDFLGSPVEYNPISPQTAFDFVEAAGWGEWMAALTRDYGAAYASGWGDFTTDNVSSVTGQTPRSFDAFAQEVFLPALISPVPE